MANDVFPKAIDGAGTPLGIVANPNGLRYKPGGMTVDWSTVAAVAGSDVTLEEGFVIRIGDKYLRHGQVMCEITASGKYGPHDPAASDGRQTLTRSKCFLVERAVRESDRMSLLVAGLEGGRVYIGRVLHAGTGTASLAAGPQLAALLAVMPELRQATP
jgi:hypothetical protein